MDFVKEFLINRRSVEKSVSEKIKQLYWEYTDVLYSFNGIYIIGAYIFEKEQGIIELCGQTLRPVDRKKPNQISYSGKYILENYEKFTTLNVMQELKDFADRYYSIGNVFPIWPGGNVHRGQSQCYDIPEIYFNKKVIRTYAEVFYGTFYKGTSLMNCIFDGDYKSIKTEDILAYSKDTYIEFLKNVVQVIDKREKSLEKIINFIMI